MRHLRFALLSCLCTGALQAATEYIKDDAGDLKIEERVFECLDITSVKVSTEDKKTFVFEVKTKAPINVTAKEPCYFIVAVNLDGDLATGTSAWTTGQDFCAWIDIEGKAVTRTRNQRGQDPELLSGATVDGNVLRFTLKSDVEKRKRITFNIRSMVGRQPPGGTAPYSVLDSSVPQNARFNEFKW